MVEIIEIHNPKDFDVKLKEISQDQEFVICYICGAEDVDGISWCSDCVNHKKIIQDRIINQTQGKLLKCWVPTREDWFDKTELSYINHQLLKVADIPCVVLIREGEVITRAECDSDFANDELLNLIAKPQ